MRFTNMRGLLPRTSLDARKERFVVSLCGRCHPRRESMSVASPPRGSRAIDRAAALLVAGGRGRRAAGPGRARRARGLPRSTASRLRRRAGAPGPRAAGGRAAACARAPCWSPTPRAGRPTPTSPRCGARAAAAGRDLAARPSNLAVPRLDGVGRVAQVDGPLPARRRELGRRARAAPRVGGSARSSWPGASCPCRTAAWRASRRAPSRPGRARARAASGCASAAGRRRWRSWRPGCRGRRARARCGRRGGRGAIAVGADSCGSATIDWTSWARWSSREASDLSARLGARRSGRRFGDDRGRDPPGPLRRDAGRQRAPRCSR